MTDSAHTRHLRMGAWLRLALLPLVALAIVSCATSQGTFVPTGPARPAKPEGTPVAVFKEESPGRPFTRVALVEAHLEKTSFIPSNYSEAEALLIEQARLAGADAIIEIKEKRSMVGETLIYHVSGTAICYDEDGT